MNTRRTGAAIVVCGASGSGKGTLLGRLTREFPEIAFSVSRTTRAPRRDEEDGVDYHFVTTSEFERGIDKGEFAEWALVHGNYYGTPVADLQKLLGAGTDVAFDIDIQGARQLRARLHGLFVFILPPSRSVLEQRLLGRGTDSDESIRTRLANSAQEIANAEAFDAIIVNNDLETAYQEFRAAYLAERLRPKYRPFLVPSLLEQFS